MWLSTPPDKGQKALGREIEDFTSYTWYEAVDEATLAPAPATWT